MGMSTESHERGWHCRALHLGLLRERTPITNVKAPGGNRMQEIRVCTYDGPGAQPVMRTVPWPKIPKKAALIKVGACGVCGTDLRVPEADQSEGRPRPFTLGEEVEL